MPIGGRVAPGFEAVREEFERNFSERGDLGAALAVIGRQDVLVDLQGGWVDPARSQPWSGRTLVHVYSTTKPFAALCLLLLVDRDLARLDMPVAEYWPAFDVAGKGSVTIRQLLSHQAGLVALRDEVAAEAIFDWDRIVALLAEETPWWEPGTAHGEHAYFYGHLVGEIVRRVDGRTLGHFFDEEVAGPWQLDFHIGLEPEQIARVSPLVGMDATWVSANSGPIGSMRHSALANPAGALDPAVVNSQRWMEAEIPALNGFGTAMAIARFYRALLDGGSLDGVKLLSEETCREMVSTQSSGRDLVLERHVDWGLGVQVENGYFGHGGLGGSSGYAATRGDFAYGYVTNTMGDHERDEALGAAVEICLETPARSLRARRCGDSPARRAGRDRRQRWRRRPRW